MHMKFFFCVPWMLDKKTKRPTLLHSIKIKNKPVRWNSWTKLRKAFFFSDLYIAWLLFTPPCLGLQNREWSVGIFVFVVPCACDYFLVILCTRAELPFWRHTTWD